MAGNSLPSLCNMVTLFAKEGFNSIIIPIKKTGSSNSSSNFYLQYYTAGLVQALHIALTGSLIPALP
ncbi:MAG: hypothetical protein JO072_07475 [Parafilimonas sp.]|nr:hypothetical protein [Parafilimonas sp.]